MKFMFKSKRDEKIDALEQEIKELRNAMDWLANSFINGVMQKPIPKMWEKYSSQK